MGRRREPLREQLLEHQFLGEIVRVLALQGRRCEVLRAEFDGSGHDIVLEEGGVLRHVQLKAMRADGKRAHVNIHTALGAKPSGCVIWILVDPETLTAARYLWLGGPPGEPLPELGDRIVRHTKGDATGVKGLRNDLRLVSRRQFMAVGGVEAIVELLFGTDVEKDILRLKRHLAAQPLVSPLAPAWLAHIQAGRFDAIPGQLDENDLVQFSHLVDGYALVGINGPEETAPFVDGVAGAIDRGLALQPSHLWAALFLEHRRLRFEGRDATPEETQTFQRLYEELRRMFAR